jgi:hypothetical protein
LIAVQAIVVNASDVLTLALYLRLVTDELHLVVLHLSLFLMTTGLVMVRGIGGIGLAWAVVLLLQ